MENPKQAFLYWVEEREEVRLAKDNDNPKPWSDDPIFQTTYFCNTDREDDRVTRWLRREFDPYFLHHAVASFIMARVVNKTDSLRKLGWPWNTFQEDKWRHVMSQPGAWGSAYIVSTNGRPMPKHEYIGGLLQEAFDQFAGSVGARVPPTLSGWHKAIQALQGMGSFMAAQVVADLKNTDAHILRRAEDWWTFAAHGPGSLRGLSWFHGEKVTPRTFESALVSAREWCYSVDTISVAHLCNQNLQNCFCEYDKYMRIASGTGRSKRKYDGK
jgi:hypothetical protein